MVREQGRGAGPCAELQGGREPQRRGVQEPELRHHAAASGTLDDGGGAHFLSHRGPSHALAA